MEAIGRAVGRPKSAERQKAISVFVHIPSKDRAAWFKWANGVPESCLYYLNALACKSHIGAATGDDHPFKKLIKDFGPERCEDDHWMEDEDQVRAASLFIYVHHHIVKFYQYTNVHSGYRMEASDLVGVFIFSCPYGGSISNSLKRHPFSGLVHSADELLRGHFVTKQGISSDESPALVRSLVVYSSSDNPSPQSSNVVQNHHGTIGVDTWGEPIQIHLPCNPQDAAYLLQQWLLDEYPEQGEQVTTLNPVKRYTLRQPLSDTASFENYIVTHYASHPFSGYWLELINTLGTTKDSSEILRMNIQALCREVTVERKQTTLKDDKKGIEYRDHPI
ncbi:hypothetical protein O0I10_004912 [Lichtheimia ornata]|uniref:Uncharacterized protein n=1 Tax=Lichtheimia ornata TaxID=688661 RepID=A0AAD7V5T4_9FUNG|nr:uncharacterized protein O0I10_004912 [Lichtheimia ornata]KAJ8659547.1 hypothetical protein O0I10_004912 [Lichtheimia ornata]